MPISTERHSGFSVSKWELNYLRCRYKAHRNKIAAAKPAIDANPPPQRPHVEYKKKKALMEERRQMRVVQENLRLLDRTINIMASTDMPTHFSKARPYSPSCVPHHDPESNPPTTTATTTTSAVCNLKKESLEGKPTTTEKAQTSQYHHHQQKQQKPLKDHPQQKPEKGLRNGNKKRVSPNKKYFDRPLTARLKRNTHIIFHWFIQRFGRYVPWWAEINY